MTSLQIEDEQALWTTRNELIAQAYRGEITPEEAELEAARIGLPRLASMPPPEAYDPLKEDRWNLAMTAAWIAWRSPDEVRENWPAYREKCSDWRCRTFHGEADKRTRESWMLEPRRPVNLLRLKLAEVLRDGSENEQPRISVKQAQESLWRKLRSGALQATAVERHTEHRVTISIEAWDDIELTEEHGKDVLQRMRPWSPHGVRYDDVLFASADVVGLWPRLPQRLDRPPPLAPLAGTGFTPLFCAPHWIATKGAAVDIGWDRDAWSAAYDALLARIAADEMELIGTRIGKRERLDSVQLIGCHVVLPFDNHAAAEIAIHDDPVLFACAFVDGHGSDGPSDSLRQEDGTRWLRLTVRKEQIADIWDFEGEADIVDVETFRSGAPGRPSSKLLVLHEFKLRCERGEICSTLAGQARQLEAWLKKAHPRAPGLGANRIETIIRHQYWPARLAAKS